MFQPAPRDAMDDLIAQYGLPREFRSLIDKFLDLKPDQQDAVVEYMRSVATALMAEDSTTAEQPDQHAIWEAEARAEAEQYYQQRLEEKKAEAGCSASPPTDCGDLPA